MKHPPSQMIWGAISEHGVAGIFFLPPGTTMNGPRYVELLVEKLKINMAVHNCSVLSSCKMALLAIDRKFPRLVWLRTESTFWIGREQP